MRPRRAATSRDGVLSRDAMNSRETPAASDTVPAWSRVFFFFFNDTPTTEIYPLSLPDALPISHTSELPSHDNLVCRLLLGVQTCARSEEHTSELQSHDNLECRLLLEKKKTINNETRRADSNDQRMRGIRGACMS